jgi:hypothetical protein
VRDLLRPRIGHVAVKTDLGEHLEFILWVHNDLDFLF